MTCEHWRWRLILPRLDLAEPLTVGPVALVTPGNGAHGFLDERARPTMDRLLLEARLAPGAGSLLLVHRSAPALLDKPEWLASFCALAAVGCLLPRCRQALRSGLVCPLSSDAFAPHAEPLVEGEGGPGFSTKNEARPLASNRAPRPVATAMALGIPRPGIVEDLAQAFQRGLEENTLEGWSMTALRRSLTLAALAMREPDPLTGPSFRLSQTVSLWLRAIEVLFQHEPREERWRKVLSRLRHLPWEDERLLAENYIIHSAFSQGRYIIQCGTLLERLVKDLYDTQDRFMAGEVLLASHHHLFQNPERPTLLALAPVVYEIGLRTFLDADGPRQAGPWSELEAALHCALPPDP